MDATRRDLAVLQGDWEQTYLEADGLPNPANDEHTAPGAICRFEGNTFLVEIPGDRTLLRGTFTIDATTSPKSITWVDAIGPDAGKHLPAIYELGENTFRFVAADEGAPRPSEFRTRPGLTLREFRRRA